MRANARTKHCGESGSGPFFHSPLPCSWQLSRFSTHGFPLGCSPEGPRPRGPGMVKCSNEDCALDAKPCDRWGGGPQVFSYALLCREAQRTGQILLGRTIGSGHEPADVSALGFQPSRTCAPILTSPRHPRYPQASCERQGRTVKFRRGPAAVIGFGLTHSTVVRPKG